MSHEPELSELPAAVIEKFLAEVIESFREAVGVDALVGPAGETTDHSISVMVHVRGHLSGVAWSFPVEIARLAATRMVPGIDPDHEICTAAAAELANILTGRGLATLADHGFHIEIEPPQVRDDPPHGRGGTLGTEHGAVAVVFHEGRPG